MPPELLPVIQITLPMIVTVFLATFVAVHSQNKRFDDLRADMNRGFDKVDQRLERIEKTLGDHVERITRLEERLPPPMVRN